MAASSPAAEGALIIHPSLMHVDPLIGAGRSAACEPFTARRRHGYTAVLIAGRKGERLGDDSANLREENQALIRRVEQAWSDGDFELLEELFDPSMVSHASVP